MTQPLLPADDFVTNFQIQDKPVRGRAIRLGAGSVSPILDRHDYPAHLAEILGQAAALAALVGSSLKFDGRLLVQAEGDGPVGMLVGEYRTDGGLRAYAKYDKARWDELARINKGDAPHMPQLFGPKGVLALIIIQNNPATQPYQGVVPLMKGSLAECAEDYFNQSEQVPTHVKMAVSREQTPGTADVWHVGGMMIQQIAGDAARGDTTDDWREAEALFGTLTPNELADPGLPMSDLLYRLFHESGVRVEDATHIRDECSCNKDRLVTTLTGMPDNALREMVEPDGNLSVDCQFCNRNYQIAIDDVTDPVS